MQKEQLLLQVLAKKELKRWQQKIELKQSI